MDPPSETPSPAPTGLGAAQIPGAIARAESRTIAAPFPPEACNASLGDEIRAPQLFVFADGNGKVQADPPPIPNQTSGNAILDTAALDAVQSSTFDATGESVAYQVTVNFQDREETCQPRRPRRDLATPNRDR